MPFYSNESQQPCPACGFNVEWTYRLETLVKMDAPHYASDPSSAPITYRQQFAVCRRCGYVCGITGDEDELQYAALNYLEEDTADEVWEETVPGDLEDPATGIDPALLVIETDEFPEQNTTVPVVKTRGRAASK